LVALTILAVTLVPLFRIYSSGVRLVVTSEQYAKALVVAESVLAEAAVAHPYSETSKSGATNDGFGWVLRVEPYEKGDELPPLFAFQSSVSWKDGRHNRTLTLNTLRLDPVTKQDK
jgi:general secretion pathway protein I